MSGARRYRPADRSAAVAALGEGHSIDAPGSHAHVADAGAAEGIALWHEPAGGETPYLGPVAMPAAGARQQFYRLVLACAEDARSRGHSRGRFHVQDQALLARLGRDFRIDPQPCGWEPNTGRPTEWEIAVDLDDAIDQLRRVV